MCCCQVIAQTRSYQITEAPARHTALLWHITVESGEVTHTNMQSELPPAPCDVINHPKPGVLVATLLLLPSKNTSIFCKHGAALQQLSS